MQRQFYHSKRHSSRVVDTHTENQHRPTGDSGRCVFFFTLERDPLSCSSSSMLVYPTTWRWTGSVHLRGPAMSWCDSCWRPSLLSVSFGIYPEATEVELLMARSATF